MRPRNLIKKFSYLGLVKESKRKGWIIPTIKDIMAINPNHIIYDEVLVNEQPTDNEDGTRCVLFNIKTGKRSNISQDWILHTMVLIDSKSCVRCTYFSECEISKSIPEQYLDTLYCDDFKRIKG